MYEGIVQELIDELGRLPGIGPKSAQRIAFHIVQTEHFDVKRLAEILLDIREKVRFYDWNRAAGEVRWMTAFDTTEADVDAFVEVIRAELS